MKNERVLITVILIALTAIAVAVQVMAFLKPAQTTAAVSYEKQGDVYMEKKLYQKAITAFYNAIGNGENTRAVWDKWLKATELSYKDKTDSFHTYTNAMRTVCNNFPSDIELWEKLTRLYFEAEEYSKAYDTCCVFNSYGNQSEYMTATYNALYYMVVQRNVSYSKLYYAPNGYAVVKEGNMYYLLNPSGEKVYSDGFEYASPVGNSLYISVRRPGEKETRVIYDGILQHRFEMEYSTLGVYSDGLIPVEVKKGKWQYYNCNTGEMVFDTYSYACGFSGGYAAVKSKDKWYVINTNGEKVSGDFDAVKLYGNFTASYENVMIASEDGVYGMYTASGEQLNNFKCADADKYYGSYISFKSDEGKWGYADTDGNVVIEPQYKTARSFAHGVGGVKFDYDLWGFVDKSGETVIEPAFYNVFYFNDGGFAYVGNDTVGFSYIEWRF